MESLIDDVFIKIGEYVSDKEKITLTMVSRKMNRLNMVFTYHEKIDTNRISKLPYFNNFECVKINDKTAYFPAKAKYVYLTTERSNVPDFVTHLTFGDKFNKSIKYIIPTSVTNL